MIALIAHDQMKQKMRDFVYAHLYWLQNKKIIATDGTANVVNGQIDNIIRAGHGPAGGDILISSHIVKGEVEAVFFFRDPLSAHPHEHDVGALLRMCEIYNVPLATNLATAECVVTTLKVNEVG